MDTRNVLSAAGQAGCSALSWTTLDGRHLWGRNFDLDCHPLDSAVLYLPRGTAYRACEAGRGRGRRRERQQISTYGTVGVGSTAAPAAPILYEGINERGLMGGQLNYRAFARFGRAVRPGTLPLQPPFVVFHLLSQCASVEEVVRTLREETSLVGVPLFGQVPTLHWSFSDRTGESIVVEPDRDGLRIYRRTIGVMTNSPSYPWHRIDLLNYTGVQDADREGPEVEGDRPAACFSGSGGQGLPGDWSSPSRFVRLAFLKKYCLRGENEEEGVARMFRLFQSVAFPLGMVRVAPSSVPEGGPAAWDYTLYTSVMCAESLRFYWTTYEDQRVRWVDMKDLARRGEPRHFPLGREPDFLRLD
ncbi:linear amide C-N hydrolase [uncultured Intestinimonas sp.]|uniref:linear amide C-N hydrolase n=1 Tax=uncultured Intestinimonas sp. TaxID=1689265 RepID=UPI0025DBF421|nr:linear amide C-N hydrolase [uncultured Intestinimonas sp.]